MQPWYKVVTPRKEVREGRSFNPDEFAIALEQVVAGTAPLDYRDPGQFFSRTYFTRALREHSGLVLRRLAGETQNTAPVVTLVTQFGGGKTHTLTALYHIARAGTEAEGFSGVADLRESAGLTSVPKARVAVFVGNAWDPQEGRETPWIDVARQLAGREGVEALGAAAQTTPPGTEAIGRVFRAAGDPVLVLFDEVLNFINRHRGMAEQFHAFIQNLTVATTGTTHGAAVISLPRSQVEMTDWDLKWQDKITKVVRRVAKDLIANDEAEISEVVRRRLFEDLGSERVRRNVSKSYAQWCFDRRAQLPPEWTAVDTSTSEKKAREFLESRFDACYPFHPATLSVFQRKWQALPQYQQTRGTLAMFAQWISWAYREAFTHARSEPLLTLGSAPLQVSEFRSVVLGQLGESRLESAITTDICGEHAHANALDADTRGPLRGIHRRVGATILFESSGGQVEKVAHLPELRFALGEPELDTTSVDNAALAVEAKAFFIRRVGSDGFQIRHQATLKKVVSDRRASLDEEAEIKPALRNLVRKEFEKGASVPLVPFPDEAASIEDSPRLTLVLLDPEEEWEGNGPLREQIAEWTRKRGNTSRLYPGSLVWCARKPGRELREKVELLLAWKKVQKEASEGLLGEGFDRSELADIQTKVKETGDLVKDEIWATYRFVILSDEEAPDGLRVIDLGAGHASGGETLPGRVVAALKSEALLNESVGAGYLDRNWPPALKDVGAWPLSSLRQSFLDGSLTRLVDPDAVLRRKILEFVERGDFGLASGEDGKGGYQRVWYREPTTADEISFEADVFLLKAERAQALIAGLPPETVPKPTVPAPEATPGTVDGPEPEPPPPTEGANKIVRLTGDVPPELWNRLGTRILPKLRLGADLTINVEFRVTIEAAEVGRLQRETKQVFDDLGVNMQLEAE